MNRIRRSLLALTLALAGITGAFGPGWAAEPISEAMDCCGSHCPCTPPPGPSGTRLPAGAAAPAAPVAAPEAAPARRAAPGKPDPAPLAAIGPERRDEREPFDSCAQPRGRDPDLGRHLAHLKRLRI